ncbi:MULTISPECIES: crossover junction endodeoxyribonuclease RuvC [Kocuria]|jgi:crossover junction endodeoxyribonuclease RuvC|uniref:crossover junction endodeoxyribonuclease RuvC n=1 Tax=Kocuria TaxID=57493 RepID=UPI00203FF34C|nr:crossover junction endodeoxyribonuclease RuvC [Kocuria rosea]
MAGNRTASLVDVGVAGTAAADPLDRRILRIWEAAERWIERYHPDTVALERVFAQTSVNTVIGTAHASGAVIAAAARHGIPVAWHTPSEVKAAVTGDGGADKASVARMVVRILRLAEAPRPADAADALAIAICHGWRGGGTGMDATAGTETHQGARPVAHRRRVMTPAQQAWAEAEARARRGGRG